MSIVVDEQPLFEPSSNIKRDLSDVVTRELFNNGIFSGSQTYDDAPNPCLRIEGYGSFGLPLNEREVMDMEVFAAGAESGVEVGRGGLAFPGDKVHIDNPRFEDYVKNTVGPALNAQVFGPKVNGFTDVNYRLRSLTLRGSGSESSLWGCEAISEDSELRQYGTLSIILPSRHVGGRIHTTHQGVTRTFETASDSAARITALAWYTGVDHNLDPIQGYTACLCYELSPLLGVQDIPRLPQLDQAAAQLEHVFRSWQTNLKDPQLRNRPEGTVAAPQFLVCLFDHTYPDGPHEIFALKSSDKLKLKQLEPWATAYGFDLHFSSVEYVEWRRHEKDPDDSSDYGLGFPEYPSYYESEYGSEDESNHGSEDESNHGSYSSDDDSIPEVMLSFKRVKTLENIPMHMTGRAIGGLRDGDSDPTSCFINDDNVDWKSRLVPGKYWDGLTAYTYKFTALVISPKKSKYVSFVFEDVDFAFAKLATLSKVPASVKDKKILTVLLQWLKSQSSAANSPSATHREVVAFLRSCADRWHDVHLFRKVVHYCGAKCCLAIMGADNLARSYQIFSWSDLNGLYTEIFSATASNALRVQLIGHLSTTAKARNDSTVKSWCQVQREFMLNTAPTFRIADISWILELVGEKQNPDDFLYHAVIPRLQAIQISDVCFWGAFLSRLSEQPRHLPTIQNCLAEIAERMSPWTTPPQPYSNDSAGKTVERQVVDAIISLLKLGIRFSCFDRCMRLLERMWETSLGTREMVYYGLLVSEINGLLPENSQIEEGWGERLERFFFRAAWQLVPSSATSLDAFRIFRIALIRSGEWTIISCSTLFTPERINDIAKKPDLLKQLIILVSHTLPRWVKSSEAICKIKRLCLAAKINAFWPLSLIKIRQDNLNREAGNPGIELLRLCFTVDLREEVGRVLARFLIAPPSNDAAYVEQGLIPILKDLPHFLYTHHLSLKHSPFSTFAAEVTKKFVRFVMRTKPNHTISSAELEATGCGCNWCNKHLVPFMLNTEERLMMATGSNHHVEERLAPTKKWVLLGSGILILDDYIQTAADGGKRQMAGRSEEGT
ncbi:hypothetical protein BDZ89DRAFT_203222 [Hymenopellis radicata]|nr:hypothetical protein BDZ89DRAFT_203222 [Hymenopellis radicata]